MKEIKFRTLRADEIECRPATIKDGKATILLYIDSRAVVRLLNETVGPMNWTMEFEEVNGQLVGKLGIWDEDKGMFIYKADTGSESNIEAQKGLFSDCYKRCISRWGVDELYTAPRIKVDDDGYGCSGFRVSHIAYNANREIVELIIVNRFGKTVYDYKDDSIVGTPKENPTTAKESLILFCQQTKPTLDKEGLKQLTSFYKFFDKKIEKDGWKGTFNASELWTRWMSRAA